MSAHPPRIELTPPEQRVAETFACYAGFVGLVFFAVGAHLLLYAPATFDTLNRLESGGAVLAGLALIVYELVRRANRTILVVPDDPRAPIAVYRKGTFAQTLSRGNITHYELRWINTLREIFAFGMGFLFSLFMFYLALRAHWSTSLFLGSLLGLVACGGLVATSIHSRVLCVHFLIPHGERDDAETIIVPKKHVYLLRAA